MRDEDIILIDDDGHQCTRREIREHVEDVNCRIDQKFGKGRYKVIFRYSLYWRKGMFYLKKRVWGLFWRYVRDGEHIRTSIKPWSKTDAFNGQFFLNILIPELEKIVGHRRINRRIRIG